MIVHCRVDHAVTACGVPCYVTPVTFTPNCLDPSFRQPNLHSDASNCQIYPRRYRYVALAFDLQNHNHEVLPGTGAFVVD